MRLPLIFLLLLPLAACASPTGSPSLCTRAAESIDPRLPPGPVDPVPGKLTISGELAAIESTIEEGIAAYDALLPVAQAAVAGAGAPGSESWVAAVERVSQLDAARTNVARGVADIAQLVTLAIVDRGWASPADRAAAERALDRYSDVDARQAATIEQMNRRLGA